MLSHKILSSNRSNRNCLNPSKNEQPKIFQCFFYLYSFLLFAIFGVLHLLLKRCCLQPHCFTRAPQNDPSSVIRGSSSRDNPILMKNQPTHNQDTRPAGWLTRVRPLMCSSVVRVYISVLLYRFFALQSLVYGLYELYVAAESGYQARIQSFRLVSSRR